jgi:hypothetical protein
MRAARPTARRLVLGVCLGIATLAGVAACGSKSTAKPVFLPTGSTSSLVLSADRATYGASDPIGVTLHNTGGQAYYALDGHSACTILRLQQQVGGSWQDVMPCTNGQPAKVLQIAPRSSVPFTFAPGNARGDPNAWTAGVYRVAVDVRTSASGSGPTATIFSAGFQVRSGQ